MSIVVLNSGGFDSVCLMHYVRSENKEDKLYSLYFSYEQLNDEISEQCSKRAAEETDAEFVKICLPKFSWTKNNFYNKGYIDSKSQYVEMRNLVFLSYALSFAESVGAEEIQMAILESVEGVNYTDVSPIFLKRFSILSQYACCCKVTTPFIEMLKSELYLWALKFGLIDKENTNRNPLYFSCDTPNILSSNSKNEYYPCGFCEDCEELDTSIKEVKQALLKKKNQITTQTIQKFFI